MHANPATEEETRHIMECIDAKSLVLDKSISAAELFGAAIAVLRTSVTKRTTNSSAAWAANATKMQVRRSPLELYIRDITDQMVQGQISIVDLCICSAIDVM